MRLENIKKRLGNFSLSIDSLNISKPGIYGLVGPNGSGKSTLAKIMTGLMEPDCGSIETCELGQRDITFLERKPYMTDDTLYNNLVYPLKLRDMDPDTFEINSLLDMMNFNGRGKQRAKSLSGGEQQKLAFLRAIIFKPKFIVADEAMSAMDLDSLDICEKTILEKQRKENSIWIIISHQMQHVRRICGYIYFMYNGKIETEGNSGFIFNENANPYVKQYLRTYDNMRQDSK